MSILKVDTINEKTTGNGVVIPGHVVQVAQSTSAANTTNSTTSVVQAMQTSTFTLKNSSNKVLVTANFITRAQGGSASGPSGVRIALYRGAVADASSVRITSGLEPQIYSTNAGSEEYNVNTLQFLDTPGLASTVYSIGFWKHPSSGDVHVYGSFFESTIILQEIAQ